MAGSDRGTLQQLTRRVLGLVQVVEVRQANDAGDKRAASGISKGRELAMERGGDVAYKTPTEHTRRSSIFRLLDRLRSFQGSASLFSPRAPPRQGVRTTEDKPRKGKNEDVSSHV